MTTTRADDEPRDLLVDLLARGVPWPIAREAIASTAIDRDADRAQTITLDESWRES